MPSATWLRTSCVKPRQRCGERRENLVGRVHVPPLFQPSVPSGADAGEHRHLLTPQARRPSPETVRQADIGRSQALPARAQEVAGLASAGSGVGSQSVAHHMSIVRSILGSTEDCLRLHSPVKLQLRGENEVRRPCATSARHPH